MIMPFNGVMPAVTTPFTADLEVDYSSLTRQVRLLLEHGCSGIVPCGSLGEGATLSVEEKSRVIATCVASAEGAPVVPGIAAASTGEAVAFARVAHHAGAAGLMVLPPYIYSSDWREMSAHVSAVINATPLPCMLYNNPPAYRTDFTPALIAELAGRHPNLVAVKESSGDVRRITAILATPGNRLSVGVGLDDIVVEGIAAGATFWIAGLADAMPTESVLLFNLARQGERAQAQTQELLRWFLPLLRFDAGIKFVQLIKLVQERVGICSARVRPPRLEVAGAELADANEVINRALATRPSVARMAARS
ncbi:MAG: dihydrodipicolinate synthase family protein [Planctomycetes bacterium]|nr:dihydrodipicolinate synthase family protein [Planctomycetota bacterium]